MADELVKPERPPEYLYELRAIAENIGRERVQESDVHKPKTTFQEVNTHHSEQQVTNASTANTSCNPSIPEASEVVRPVVEPESKLMANDSPSADVGHVGPAWHIPMTQERSLEDLPSQLDLDWQDSVSSTPTPSPAATQVPQRLNANDLGAGGSSEVVEPQVVLAVDTFAEVSQIAAEVVMAATQ